MTRASQKPRNWGFILVLILLLGGAGFLVESLLRDGPGGSEARDSGVLELPRAERRATGQTPDRPQGPIRTEPEHRPVRAQAQLQARAEQAHALQGLELRRVAGRVLNEQGAGLEGARVEVFEDISRLLKRPLMGASLAQGQTGARGSFRLELKMGLGSRYILRVTHGEFPQRWVYPLDPLRPQSLQVLVRMGTVRPVSGQVRGADGLGLGGARVSLFDLLAPTDDEGRRLERETLTAADGSFSLPAVSAGRKRVLVRAAGFSLGFRDPLLVRAERATPDLMFRLARGGTLSGLVEDAQTGQPLPAVRISLRPVARGAGTRRSHPGDATRSDGAGVFSLGGLPAGPYFLQVTAAGYELPAARNVVVPAEEDLLIRLNPAASLQGRVVAESGKPLGGVSVVAGDSPDPSAAPWSRQVKSHASDGSFRLTAVPGRPVWIFARAPGFGAAHLGPLQLDAGQSLAELELVVQQGALVLGRVLDDQGRPLAGARVTLLRKVVLPRPKHLRRQPLQFITRKLLTPLSEVTTRADGSFLVVAMAAGSHALEVSAGPDHAPHQTELFQLVTGGERLIPDIQLLRSAGIVGVVLDHAGQPDPQARVSVVSRGRPRVSESVLTDAEGHFEVLGLPPGVFQVVVVQRQGRFDARAVSGRGRAASRTVHLLQGVVENLQLRDR